LYTYADSFWIYMEQRAVIYFFMFKGQKSMVIYTEFELVYHLEVLALLTVEKWRRRFHQGRRGLFDDLRSGRHVTSDTSGRVALCLKKGRLVHARCFVATSGLERRGACGSFMACWFEEL
jgi:hypothetical protein